jgi:hypothetical protein
MKFSLFLAAVTLGWVGTASAQLDIDFGDPTVYPGPNVAGSDGWTIDDATPGLSFLVDVGGDQWGALGGYYDVPTGSGAVLSHSVGALAKTSDLLTKFFIQSSDAYPGRDPFGFRFNGGTSGLFEIQFVPDGSNFNLLNIFLGIGGATPTATGTALFYDTTYTLKVDFNETGSGGGLEMFGTIGGGASSFSISGSLPGEANATWTSFDVTWDAVDGGDNYIALQGFSSVPEPGSAMASLLAGVMGLSVTMRRRRRA